MRILGLDLSLTSTGYVLLNEEHVVWHGAIGGGVLRDVERLMLFDRWIRQELRDRRMDHIALEGYSFASSVGLAQQGELGGIIKLAIHQARIPVQIFPPSTWKKQLLGKGNLAKDMVRVEAFKRYGVEFVSQDTLDAWAVAMCLRRQLLGLDKPEPKTRKRSVSAGKVPPLIPAMEASNA